MMENYEQLLEQLKNKEIQFIFVPKQDFMNFRHLLIARSDFKHFRGVAEQGGNITYFYEDDARS